MSDLIATERLDEIWQHLREMKKQLGYDIDAFRHSLPPKHSVYNLVMGILRRLGIKPAPPDDVIFFDKKEE